VVDQPVTTVEGAPRHTVKAGAGDLVCAQVAVSRKSGLTSPRSAIRCQTAG
jgi:glycerol dehydrogenase-like iron-containing ADH family enzyme